MEKDWLDRLSPQIHLLWHGSMNSSWIEPPRRLYDHQLAVFTEGECTVFLENKSIKCSKGTYMIIGPGKLHSATASGGKGFSLYTVHFDWIFSGHSFSKKHCVYHPGRIANRNLHPAPSFIPSKRLRGPIGPIEKVTELMQELVFRWQSPITSYKNSCRGLFLEILLLILSRDTKHQTKVPKSDYLANEIKILLQKSFLEPISIRDTLESMGYSYPHLCRIFTKAYGTAPLEYLNRLRLEHAKKLIISGKYSIKETAYGSGFNDPHYFARVFRKQNGKSPTDFLLDPQKKKLTGLQ